MRTSCTKKFVLTLAFSLACIQANAQEYDANRIADIFYALNGDANDPSKKVNHTKGFCASGEFVPAKDIANLLDIGLLSQSVIPTQVRYSSGGGSVNISDKDKPKGLALKINGESDSWEIVMLNTEINFAKNPEEFGKFFEMRIPQNGKVDKENVAKMFREVASYRNFVKYLDENIGVYPSLANVAYHSIHTFYFKDKSGKMIPARFKFVPKNGVKFVGEEEAKKLADHYLEDRFKQDVSKKPIEYTMILVLANPGDIIDDTTALWNGRHKEIEVGTLSVKQYDGKDCNVDVYMPITLPKGVGEPEDPLFQVRNETYINTFSRRQP